MLPVAIRSSRRLLVQLKRILVIQPVYQRSLCHWQNMDPKTKQLYLADRPASVVRLEIRPHFEELSKKQKRYAHHISRSVQANTNIEYGGNRSLMLINCFQSIAAWVSCYSPPGLTRIRADL